MGRQRTAVEVLLREYSCSTAKQLASLALRLNNLTDKWYADRADFAFGEYRYFPGRGRELFFQVAYQTP